MEAVKKKGVGTDLTEGVIWKVLLTFAVPIILTNVIQQLYSMVDLIVAGKYIGAAGTIGVSTGGELSDFLTPVQRRLVPRDRFILLSWWAHGRIKKSRTRWEH